MKTRAFKADPKQRTERDGFHLVGSVVVIRKHADIGTAPGVGIDGARGLYDFPHAVDVFIEVVARSSGWGLNVHRSDKKR